MILKFAAGLLLLVGLAANAQAQCCRVCKSSKACGNSCISLSKTCRKGPGCACDAGGSSPLRLLPVPKSISQPPKPPPLTPPPAGSKIRPPPVIEASTASVIDGDSLRVGGFDIRLEGIDAPEPKQICQNANGDDYRCGAAAAEALGYILESGAVTCLSDGLDRYGRTLAHCTAGGIEVNRMMVSSGWAFAYVHFSTEFAADEQAARDNRRGLWAGTATPPWQWRHP